MKKWSIRTKITLLFTIALTLMATLSCLIVFSVSHQVIQKTVRDNLIENVERNVDEIEYYERFIKGNLTNIVFNKNLNVSLKKTLFVCMARDC